MFSPLVGEIPYRDPARLLPAVARLPFPLLLDSALADPRHGRYSFLAADPFDVITDPASLEAIRRHLGAWTVPAQGFPFPGGVAGYIGYEALHARKGVPRPGARDLLPDLLLGVYDVVAGFDHVARRAWIVSTGFPEQSQERRRNRADRRARWLETVLAIEEDPTTRTVSPLTLTADAPAARYCEGVRRIIEYIRAGDIYQANLALHLSADVTNPDPVGWYLRLRGAQPAPFAAYLGLDGAPDHAILSASMERFLRLSPEGRVETRPIKGTAPRWSDPDEDATAGRTLLASAKDRAENVMIVDLLRNDLAKVCRPGSVQVSTLCGLESYAAVHHMVSAVEGELEPGRSAVDLLEAAFPGGSITGAPKKRAMEIIAELESLPRGPYCGAIGYFGFDGTMDTSIPIRTAVLAGNRVRLGVGAGITALSDPEAEYSECLAKAAGIVQALA